MERLPSNKPWHTAAIALVVLAELGFEPRFRRERKQEEPHDVQASQNSGE
ncbi:hypothetical protein HSR122_1356 [Halapricum desulfuricans]|uniref:Uncharacterized protein n=1 Tax=Halapricum desulfuricans TaxID=2841257 RepID=A0A897NCF4_9EURY|nr:hypothetical protein HSR122_1356 [Halapricum desulfuricans]